MASSRRHPGASLAFIAIVLAGFSTAAGAIEFAGGTGEPNDPYQIATVEHLSAIGADPGLWDKHFRLVANIDLTSYMETNFPIIGYWQSEDDANPFRGTFDGNGHAIANFSQTCWDRDNVGLFGYVAGPDAEIRNLELINPHVYGQRGENIGSLLGRLDRGIITDCRISHGIVLAEGGSYVGSLVGRVQGGRLERCHAVLGVVSGGENVGGLVGGLEYGTIADSSASPSVRGETNVGGLAGTQSGVVTECYALGAVTGDHNLGGLVGHNQPASSIRNCYSIGDVAGKTAVGGLVGHNQGIVTNGYSAGPVSGTTQVGGLIGESDDQADCVESFWDVETAKQENSAGGSARITAEMRTQATFLKWGGCGSEAVWTIEQGKDYPRLSWEARPGETIALAPLMGDGTEDAPYLIHSAEELNRVGLMTCVWAGHFRLMADIDLIDYGGTLFNIIGDRRTPFAGVFDGNGHTIANFRYTNEDADDVGLFGCVDGPEAEIRDLILSDPNVEGGTGHIVGSLAGRLEHGAIARCCVTGGQVCGYWEVGGLVGYNHGVLAESYVASRVSGEYSVGGLAGSNEGMIRNCYAIGTIGGYSPVGGLVGGNSGSVECCYAACGFIQTAPIHGRTRSSSSSLRSCGLVGWSEDRADVFCSFWDIETSASPDSAGGDARSTEQMQMAATFFAWGACGNEGVWTIDDGRDYPRLWWQNLPGEPIGPTRLSDFLVGHGAPDDPYLIHTPDELNLVGLFRCDWDKHFRLMADIDLSLYTGMPLNLIGTRDLPFTGVFDGNGHSISHVTCHYEGKDYVGLFRHVADPNARIMNLGLIDPNIVVKQGQNIGALVAWMEDGSVVNCYAAGGCINENTQGTETVGGLVGRLDVGKISGCHSNTTVSGDSQVGGLVGQNEAGRIARCHYAGTLSGEDCVGGLVGVSQGIISGCSATGQISIGGDGGGLVGTNYGIITCSRATCDVDAWWADTVGGLVGGNRGTVGNCYARVNITCGWVYEYPWEAMGGLVGDNGGSLINCYAVGRLSHRGSAEHVGGLVGYRAGTNTNCFYSVEISTDDSDYVRSGLSTEQIADANTYVASGWDFTEERANGTSDLWEMPPGGGAPALVRLSETPRRHVLEGGGIPEDPYRVATPEELGAICHYDESASFMLTADIDLSGITWTTAPIPDFEGHLDGAGFVISNLNVDGGDYSGLFGTLGRHARIERLGIEDANVVFANASAYVGILAGRNQGAICSCYVGGELRNQHDNYWGHRVGPLVGHNDGGDIAQSYCMVGMAGGFSLGGGLVGTNAGRLTHCYAVNYAVPGRVLTGLDGLVGWNDDGRVVHCFWDAQTSGIGVSAGGRGVTTAQMKDPDTYSLNGWARDLHWVLDGGEDYPRLAWEGRPGQSIPEPVIDWLQGGGTAEDPYTIASPHQLALIGTAGVLWDKAFVLISNLDLSGIDWLPIGVCPGSEFTGRFDGDRHVIRNLAMDATGTSASYLGLFGCIGSQGQVARLGLRDAEIKGGDNSEYLGVLAGCNYGIVTQCYTTGAVIGGKYSRDTGGLAGANSQGTIADCYAATDTSSGGSVVGGLVGRNDRGTLAHSHAAGRVSGKYGSELVGGLAGDNESGSIIRCYFLGTRMSTGIRGHYTLRVAPNNGFGLALQETQMCQQASFIGWDFENVWMICEGRDYPRLRWEGVECDQ